MAAAWALPAPAAHVPSLGKALGIRLRLPDDNGVALTFDDGPHPEGTPAVLDALDEARAVATFFVVGEQVERWPEVVAEIAERGHEVALHGYRHVLLLRRSPRALADDLDRAAGLIVDATGRAPTAYRPPYGVFSGAALGLVKRRGWTPYLWSRWGRDWSKRATPDRVASRTANGLTSGDVVLLHDADHYSSAGSWRTTVAALPRVLDAVASLGTSFTTLKDSR